MAWSWSHTAEGIEGFRAQLHAQPRAWLLNVWSEWKANPEGHFRPRKFGSDDFDERRAIRAYCSADAWMSNEALADRIFDLAERQSTCTNGGWEAWACPYGCGSHTLPFDAPEEEGGEE